MNDTASRPRLRTAAANLALVFFSVLLTFAMIEAGMRLYARLHPPPGKGFFWEPNDKYGWNLTAGREGPFYNDKHEFTTQIRINSQGLRDVEHSYRKPSGVFRILILGDSYMEGLQVNLDQSFARLLEGALNTAGTQRIEVVNGGVSSYGTDNELLFFRNEGYKYDPDLVLLSFTTSNDVRENYPPLNRMAIGANIHKPGFVLDADGKLKMEPGIPGPPPLPWWRKLMVGDFLYHKLGGKILLPGGNPYAIPPPKDDSIPYVPPDLFVYAPNYRPEVQTAWRVTEELIRTLRGEVNAHGAKLVVMVHNGPWAHYDDRWKLMCIQHPIAMKTWDRRKPNRLIDEFLSAEQVPYFDLFDTFEAAKDREPLFFNDDPHWRPIGHRLAAEAAARFLITQALVPTGKAPTSDPLP